MRNERAGRRLAFASLALVGLAGAAPAQSAPYQAAAQAKCPTGANCILTFPTVPSDRFLLVKHIGCVTRSNEFGGAAFYNSILLLETNWDRKLLKRPLGFGDRQSQRVDRDAFYSIGDLEVTFWVQAGEALSVELLLSEGTFADQFNCTVSGELTVPSP